jgi:hypothetical protein
MKAASAHGSTCTCLEHPYSDEMSVRVALHAYLDENGFTVEAYDDKWTEATIVGIPVKVPNNARHRWAIMLHDLHHVATGYGTDHVGEGEVSAWEMRGGLRALGLYVGSIVTAGTMFGLLLAPRRTRSAWKAASGHPSLFGRNDDYEGLLAMNVGELRAALGVPLGGISTAPRKLHSRAPKH